MATVSGKLPGLQMGRGLAALAVVCSHVARVDGSFSVDSIGTAAVEFFFALSGFLMLRLHEDQLSRPAYLWPFLRKRFLRIVPLYWAVLSFYLLLGAQFGSSSVQHWGGWSAISAILLLPGTGQTLSVSWSLTYELAFYSAFAVMIFRRTAGLAVLAAALGASIAAWLYGGDFPFALDFAAGMAVAATSRPFPTRACLAIGTAMMALACSLHLSILVGAASACLLAGLAQIDRVPKAMETLGDASYSIYLIHFPALAFVGREFGVTSPLALIAVGIGSGLVLHLTIEKPLLRALRSHRPSPSTVPATAL